MGQLVNSRVFRYQFFNRKELFFSEKSEYASLMMKLKNLEGIVSQFFFKKNSLKELGLIYHSIEVVKKKKVYEVKIFLYDTNFEEYLKECRKKKQVVSMEKLLNVTSFRPYLLLMNKRLLYLESTLLQNLSVYLKSEVKISFYGVRNVDISGSYVAKYLCTKLKQGYSLNEILRELEWGLRNFKFLRGFRIACHGRFDRKARAHHTSKSYGSVPFSTISKNIDFGRDEVILKFGLCSVHVWLHFAKEKSDTYSFMYQLNEISKLEKKKKREKKVNVISKKFKV